MLAAGSAGTANNSAVRRDWSEPVFCSPNTMRSSRSNLVAIGSLGYVWSKNLVSSEAMSGLRVGTVSADEADPAAVAIGASASAAALLSALEFAPLSVLGFALEFVLEFALVFALASDPVFWLLPPPPCESSCADAENVAKRLTSSATMKTKVSLLCGCI